MAASTESEEQPVLYLVYVQDMGGREVAVATQRVTDCNPLVDIGRGPEEADWIYYLSTAPIRDPWIGRVRSKPLYFGMLHKTQDYTCIRDAA